ncbi:hypothetical protein CI102_6987 [Trichoderma harzianum]|nr:hypothetical protein CI102_6987 [Trichoderma harzianum]
MLSPSIPYTPPTTLNHTQKSKNKKQAKENTCSQASSELHLVPHPEREGKKKQGKWPKTEPSRPIQRSEMRH